MRAFRVVHGTSVASIIAAVSHGDRVDLPKDYPKNASFSGVVTSVPDLDYRVHFYEVGKATSRPGLKVDFKSILRALDDILERRSEMDVVNLSIGAQCTPLDLRCTILPQAFPNQTREYKAHFDKMPEVLFVVAAGNLGVDARLTTPATLSTSSVPSEPLLAAFVSPAFTGIFALAASLNSPNVITVGAFDPDHRINDRWNEGELASSHGPAITIGAPGSNIWAVDADRTVLIGNSPYGYRADSGTSYATPIVTGVVALLRSIDPDIQAWEVIEILRETGTETPICTNSDPDVAIENCPVKDTEEWRVLNADAAIRELLDRRGISISESSTPPVTEAETSTMGSPATDREALVALFNATAGPDWWRFIDNWLSDRPLNQWYGVNTDAYGRVTKLDLINNWMRGELPPELGNLSKLEYLDLTSSYLMGAIPPELGNLTNLRTLLLDNNPTMGSTVPPELGNLSNLEVLNLSHLNLRGEIPSELGNLSNLRTLMLHDNRLTGKIPEGLGKLPNLTRLGIAYNQLTGCIPPGLREVRSNDLSRLGLQFCDSTPDPVATQAGAPFARNPAEDFNDLPELPEGVWSDGQTMWISYPLQGKILAYDLATKERVPARDFNDLGPVRIANGIWSDGTTMWVSDWQGSMIFAFNVETMSRDPSKDIDTPDAPVGLWSDGRHMWVTTSNSDTVYAYDIATRSRTPEWELTNLSAFGNDIVHGLWSDGKTMWVADPGDGKIYAYDLQTKARVPNLEFNTLNDVGNDKPLGLWSNGATMWVGGWLSADKVFAYNMPVD